MKDIAHKYSEQLRELNFPNKSEYTQVTVKDENGNEVCTFIKGNIEQLKKACLVLSTGTSVPTMMRSVKERGWSWKEVVLDEYDQEFSNYTGRELQIWDDFETDIINTYLPGVPVNIQDDFYHKCYSFAKTRSEDMGGIEELFEAFAEYVVKK
jgi:hypothetical protein